MPRRDVYIRSILGIVLGLSTQVACAPGQRSGSTGQIQPLRPLLTMMSLVNGRGAEFERNHLTPYVDQLGYRFQYLPAFQSDNRVDSYRQLFRERSLQPDLLELDIIWPAIFADHLVDLKPYLGQDVHSFPAEILQAFTINGRLVAVPVFMDTGLLYYRSDLLKKYGFAKPPETWDELEHMAKVIQRRERQAGQKEFWGFVWPGSPSEGLTCNAFEWLSSQAGEHILESDHTIRVYNRRTRQALERAASWVGTITPPGVIDYDEDDSWNVWAAGHAAFIRGWAYAYNRAASSKSLQGRFGITRVPGGINGQVRALGGNGVAVSRYSEHRAEAVMTLRYLVSASLQAERAQQVGSVPTRWPLQNRPDVMANTPFHGSMARQVMTGVVARPSSLAGSSYDRVSRAYFEAVHSVLTHQSAPDNALLALEKELVNITGFRAVREE